MKTQDRIDLFVKKFKFKPEAYEVCPHFERYCVNKCTLHKNFSQLETFPEDPQKKCKVNKQIRKEIGTYFKLKNLGLNVKEFASLRRSIQMKKEFFFTRDESLKMPKTALQEQIVDPISNQSKLEGDEYGE